MYNEYEGSTTTLKGVIQMDYIDSNLGAGENVILRAKVNWLAVIAPVLWGMIIEAAYIVLRILVFGLLGDLLSNMFGGDSSSDGGNTAFLVVKIIITVVMHFIGWKPTIKKILRLLTTKLAVTNKRIIGKVGIFSIHTIDFHIDKVDNVSYGAGFWGNLFHYYNVSLAGTGDKRITVPCIANAQAFKNTVSDAIEKHAEEARKAQAADIAAAMSKTNP